MKFLKLAWKKWLTIAGIIGNFQAQVILSVFYIILFWPLGVGYRFFSDTLKIKRNAFKKSAFLEWEHEEEDLVTSKKPF